MLSRRTINGDDVTAGTDPKDCKVKKANNQWYTPREAQASGCLNKDSPDQYGHYREAKYAHVYATTNPRLLDTTSTFLPFFSFFPPFTTFVLIVMMVQRTTAMSHDGAEDDCNES